MKLGYKNFKKKAWKIFIISIPNLLMVGLIPLVQNDFILTLFYTGIIFLSLMMKYQKGEMAVLLFGFFSMIFFEFIFISTGVETFERNSLFGIMPLWLPFLWGYGFIAIKRGAEVLND